MSVITVLMYLLLLWPLLLLFCPMKPTKPLTGFASTTVHIFRGVSVLICERSFGYIFSQTGTFVPWITNTKTILLNTHRKASSVFFLHHFELYIVIDSYMTNSLFKHSWLCKFMKNILLLPCAMKLWRANSGDLHDSARICNGLWPHPLQKNTN